MGKLIKFNRPYVPEDSIRHSLDSLNSDHHQGDGPFSKLATKLIENLTGGEVLLTPSCTHALEMASMLAGIGPGDEVIMPSFTFTSAATAVVQFGGTPVFVDIDQTTGCIDASKISDAITVHTKAISWVNYAGNTPKLDSLLSIANAKNLFLIEDNAHGLGGTIEGKKLGNIGHVSTSSFHATKNIQCGEGGALTLNSPALTKQASIFREKGTDRSRFILGEVKKYQWVDRGSSYLLAESLAAILLGQLENYATIQSERVATWNRYHVALSELLLRYDISILESNASNIAHMFALIFPTKKMRDDASIHLYKSGIEAYSHYQPLHSSVGGVKYGRAVGTMDNTIEFSSRILRLPVWSSRMTKESELVIDGVIQFLNSQN
jgi:dTDP-4-amino-4,6-dideoxygalactose transaminase